MKLLLHNTGRSRYLVNMNPKHKRASLWTVASGLWANSGLAEVIWKTLLVWAQFSLPALPSTSAVTYNTFPILLQGYFSQGCQWSQIVPLCGGFAMWKSVQEGPLSKWEGLSLQGQFSHYLVIILFYFFLRQLIQGAIIVVIFLCCGSQLTVPWRGLCLFHIKPHCTAMLSRHYWTETDLTLEMKIWIVMSHPGYPSIRDKTMKHSACGMIWKTKALQLLILNHSNWTMHSKADWFWSRSDEFQPPLQLFKGSP